MSLSLADVLVALVLLGTVAGFLAGLLGVGGALMMIPFITFLLSTQGVDPDSAVKMAIATGMSTIVVTSLACPYAPQTGGGALGLGQRLSAWHIARQCLVKPVVVCGFERLCACLVLCRLYRVFSHANGLG